VLERTVSLEVHLPELIGCLLLEADVGLSRPARVLADALVAAQHLMRRRYCRHRLPVALQAMRNLARSPSRMGIAQSHNLLLNRSRSAIRAVVRAPRAGGQCLTPRIVALDPFVASLGANPKLPAKRPPVHSLLLGNHHKLSSLVHDRHLSPRHGSPPCSTNPADFDLSTMSPNRCKLCLRAEHCARNDDPGGIFAHIPRWSISA